MPNKLTIDQINIIYKNKNLECLSNMYINNKQILEWKCITCKFLFNKSRNFIDREFNVCKNCKHINALNKVKTISKNKAGKCLSNKYLGSNNKLKFECYFNHIFEATYANVVNNDTWCPYCSGDNNLSEEICRKYFNDLFGKIFKKIRPSWLRKHNGYCLELDGYCEELNLAFEHNGTHHYYENTWNRSLSDVLENDSIKIETCKKLNVNLIIIPQLFKKTKVKDLKNFILEQCKLLNIYVPYDNKEISLKNIYSYNKFDEYKSFALKKNGKCISEYYYGSSNEKLIWECGKGHQWKQFPYVIKKGSWCPVCTGQKHSKNIIKLCS